MKEKGAADEGKVEVEEKKTPEQVAADEREAEEAFEAGVKKTLVTETTGEASPSSEGKVITEKDDAAAKAEAAAKATADAEAKRVADEKARADADAAAKAAAAAAAPWKEDLARLSADLTSQVSKIAGHVGGFKRTLETIEATGKAAAAKKGDDIAVPSKLEIKEALADPEKWKQLQEDFPEWMGPVFTALTDLRKDVLAVAKAAEARPAPAAAPAAEPVKAEPVDTSAIVAEAEERAYVRLKHPDWKEICSTPAFAKDWLPKQSEEIRALGASDKAEDAIKLFDTYKAHQKKLADEAAAKAKNETRLAAAVTTDGTAEPPQVGISDDEAFERGVKKVRTAAK